ncbi:MAG: cation-translocating P-type ATPase [Candidatus Hermodarchaeota archaeon]
MTLVTNPWSKSSQSVLDELQSNSEIGLSNKEIERRINKYGKNLLVEEKRVSFFRVFTHEVVEPMILLLIGVGIVYSIFGELRDAITIFIIISLLVFVEIYNEYKAKKKIASLKELATPLSIVIRDKNIQEVDPKNLVPGDILLLRVGQKLPADARLIESYGLQIDESTLTGESIPVSKNSEKILPEKTDLIERVNIIFAGTIITRGKGKAVVTATSIQTELGKIAGLTKEIKEPKTPLQLAMKQLSTYLVLVALFFCVLIPLIGIFQGRDPVQMILTGLSLSFATIPEELPIIIMIVLALGAYTLTKQKGLVKYLRTAETLGSVTVIATDKTGTITENKMTVSKLYLDGKLENLTEDTLTESQKHILEVGILLNDVIIKKEDNELIYTGDPMEIALIEAAEKRGIIYSNLNNKYSLVEEFTFDNQRMMMSQIYTKNNMYILYAKGATEVILNRSVDLFSKSGKKQLSDDEKNNILNIVNEMAGNGLRVIAFAFKQLDELDKTTEDLEYNLTFLGLIGFIDPPRKEVKNAISITKSAGVRVLMITGDYERTANAVAKEVGIMSDKIIVGHELEEMSEAELKKVVKNTNIFARTTPEHKLKIVKALKENGERVAVTGDGINDAPALKMADIGVAMGATGTDVARSTADMVLIDNNFTTITLAIEQGRKLYDNLKKGVRYYLAVKLALIVIFLLPILFDIPLPFAPIQIILLELFMDLAASATFVVEPNESDVMKKPPRDPKEKFMDLRMIIGIIIGGICLFTSVLVVYFIYYLQGQIQAQAAAFGTWMVSHVFLAYNMRTNKDPLYKIGIFSNKLMILWGVAVMITLIIIIYIPPLQVVFKIMNLNAFDWLIIFIVSFISTFWIEILKIVQRKR